MGEMWTEFLNVGMHAQGVREVRLRRHGIIRAIGDGEVNCAMKVVDRTVTSYCNSSESTILFDCLSLKVSPKRL